MQMEKYILIANNTFNQRKNKYKVTNKNHGVNCEAIANN